MSHLDKLNVADQARFEWMLYCKAYAVHERTPNAKIKTLCVVVGSHMQGKYWCQQHGHPYRAMDELNYSIVENEFNALNLGKVK